MTPEAPHVWLFTTAALPYSMVCAWAFRRITEHHTNPLRRSVMRRIRLG